MSLSNEDKVRLAKHLLDEAGAAYRIWTAEDVDSCAAMHTPYFKVRDDAGVFRSNLELIVEHVMKGDDWRTMAKETSEDDANLHAIINGTKSDHPEWFMEF